MPSNIAVRTELSDEQRAELEAWTRRRTSAQALAQRSRIVLLAAEGLKNSASSIRHLAELPRDWRFWVGDDRGGDHAALDGILTIVTGVVVLLRS